MAYWQIIPLVLTLALLSKSLVRFLHAFTPKKELFYSLFLTLILFTAGFGMRLLGNEQFIDLGFYFTDVSWIFAYMLFTAAMILGQKKYWRI